MYKLLIVDDEPLARMGISSILSSMEQLELLPSVSNGQAALDIIQTQHPDIVISDIKMPVMDGLTLLKEVYLHVEPKPVFIMLTSYEDFEYVRTSIKYEACYYLMKMELSHDTLHEALEKAFSKLETRNKQLELDASNKTKNINMFLNRFYFNLLSYAYHSKEDICAIAQNFDLDFEAPYYRTLSARLNFENRANLEHTRRYEIYMAATTTLRENLLFSYPCHFVAWIQDTIGIIIPMQEDILDSDSFKELLLRSADLIHQYFGCQLTYGIGKKVTSMLALSDSFSASLAALEHKNQLHPEQQIFYFRGAPDTPQPDTPSCTFMTIQELNRHLILAIENYDSEIFKHTIDRLSAMTAQWSPCTSIGCISSVIHVIITCLDDGEETLTAAFEDLPLSYQSVYTYNTREEIQTYLNRLKSCMIIKMNSQKINPKYKIVLTAQNYIHEHIYDKLSLNETAANIGVSPNYLSSLFGIYSDYGFSDYVSNAKIQKAKEILSHENKKVYEVSQLLGFENPHYFSKVYKKFTGYSPSETPYAGDSIRK